MKNKNLKNQSVDDRCSRLLHDYKNRYPLERDPWSVTDLPRTASLSKVLESMEIDMDDVSQRNDPYISSHFTATYNILLCFSRLYKETKNKSIFDETYFTYPDFTHNNNAVNNSLIEYSRRSSKSSDSSRRSSKSSDSSRRSSKSSKSSKSSIPKLIKSKK